MGIQKIWVCAKGGEIFLDAQRGSQKKTGDCLSQSESPLPIKSDSSLIHIVVSCRCTLAKLSVFKLAA